MLHTNAMVCTVMKILISNIAVVFVQKYEGFV